MKGAAEAREGEDVQWTMGVWGRLLRSPTWTEVGAIKNLYQVIPFSL